MGVSLSGMPSKESPFVMYVTIIDVLKAFDNEVTRLEYLEEEETVIATSKGKSVKFWKLPKEWRDAKLVADQQKKANKRIIEHNKNKVIDAVRKAEEDSDDDDLAGWHLDWCINKLNHSVIPYIILNLFSYNLSPQHIEYNDEGCSIELVVNNVKSWKIMEGSEC